MKVEIEIKKKDLRSILCAAIRNYYCEGNCINRIGCDFLREIDASGSRCYCMECAEKMFTREEFKTLEAEALDRYLMHLDELQRDNAGHGYGVCL